MGFFWRGASSCRKSWKEGRCVSGMEVPHLGLGFSVGLSLGHPTGSGVLEASASLPGFGGRTPRGGRKIVWCELGTGVRQDV